MNAPEVAPSISSSAHIRKEENKILNLNQRSAESEKKSATNYTKQEQKDKRTAHALIITVEIEQCMVFVIAEFIVN